MWRTNGRAQLSIKLILWGMPSPVPGRWRSLVAMVGPQRTCEQGWVWLVGELENWLHLFGPEWMGWFACGIHCGVSLISCLWRLRCGSGGSSGERGAEWSCSGGWDPGTLRLCHTWLCEDWCVPQARHQGWPVCIFSLYWRWLVLDGVRS